MQPANPSTTTIKAPADNFFGQFLAATLMMPPCCREKCDGDEMSKAHASEPGASKRRAIPTTATAPTATCEGSARALTHGCVASARALLAQLEDEGKARGQAHEDFGLVLEDPSSRNGAQTQQRCHAGERPGLLLGNT